MAVKQTFEPRPEQITFEDFLVRYDGEAAEWVAGEALLVSPAKRKHQKLTLFLSCLMHHFAEDNELGEVFTDVFLMRLGETGRCPDVLFVRKEHEDRITDSFLSGPADIAVEIVSADSVGRDRGDKYIEYERAGIPEFWLIDPDRQVAEFYVLNNGRYRLAEAPAGRFNSSVLQGFWLEVEWLWQMPLPKIKDVLKAWES